MRMPISGQRGAGFPWPRTLLRASRSLTALMLLVAPVTLLPVRRAVAEDPPVVSPDRIEDSPSIKPDPYPDFDNFAWRAFIALNWPSLTDPAHRGGHHHAPNTPGAWSPRPRGSLSS